MEEIELWFTEWHMFLVKRFPSEWKLSGFASLPGIVLQEAKPMHFQNYSGGISEFSNWDLDGRNHDSSWEEFEFEFWG